MCENTNSPESVNKPVLTRKELETQLLRGLFARDARIWRKRTMAGDRLTSQSEALEAASATRGTRPIVVPNGRKRAKKGRK